ncbi:hypothetical protein KRP22_014924 [Phytophthora ramorum]|uniref:Uncharacterized protein n=1 Tax=Phytophthora ramorum TaxID=164328 RepID=H3GJK4_PHYRM|nr:hypothetical protein KRP23_11898 [Phytophthora ramorum]KAH7496126.1 hypothetical protein KRP22_14020 [Phytophthora ramorum]
MASASRSSSSSGVDVAIETPAPSPAVYTKASENVCMWSQQSSDACDSPRSCYDCLNSSPGDGVQCVITSAGLCSTMSDYVWQEDFRLNTSDYAPHYFPSTNATYCESSDPVCVACDASQFTKSASGASQPSQFCVGSDGCVCVGFCESPVYSNLVSNKYCATLSSTTTANVMGISVGDIVTIVILCFTIPVIVYLWWVRCLHKRRFAREEAFRHRPLAHGPLLPLVGWKKYCADTLANQTPIMGAVGDGSVAATSTAAEVQPETDRREAAGNAQLTNLQVAALTIELEDPQHPLTAVTSTGRRRSSIDNTNVVRPRPSQPLTSGNEDDGGDDEIDARATPYAQLEDRTA